MSRWLALSVALAACGTSAARATRARRDDGCGPSAMRLGESCWSAEGTHWRVEADGPGGEYRFELTLLAAGRVRSTDTQNASPASDEWFQDKRHLRIFLSDRFVEYRATIENGTVLVGEAINVRGQRWGWRGVRVFGESICAANEARLEGTCLTVAGTRWEIRRERGAPQLVEFLRDGRLGTHSASGRWEQSGQTLRFSLDGSDFVAQLRTGAELAGRFSGRGGGRFTARRIDTIPPLVRR